jgi:uncharacterized membrane protein YbhN (UPF0104 family)
MIGLVIVVTWLGFHHRSLFQLADRLLFFLSAPLRKQLLDFAERFVDGTLALRRPSLMAATLLCSVLVWSLEAVAYLLVMRGLELPLPAWASLLTMVVANFGIAAPSAPGYLGVFDAVCSGTLMALGIGSGPALSYAIAMHILLYVTVTGSGLACTWHLGLKISDLAREGRASGTVSLPGPP